MEPTNTPCDIIAIGDIVVDAFVELEDAKVTCNIDNEDCTISMRFGDKIPYKNLNILSAVGNSPNAAVACARLGLRTGIVTHLGHDQNGTSSIEQLKKEGIDTTYVVTHTDLPTNFHIVLQYEAERTILIKHEDYARTFPQDLPEPKWVYLSSLGSNSEPYHDDISNYLETHPDVKLCFQPGTFQMKLGTERLARLYRRAELFVCNKDEAARILKFEAPIGELLRSLHGLGPQHVVITDGPNGLWYSDNDAVYHLPMYPDPKPPVERTGAGDATTSTIMAALALGMEPKDAILWGPVNSMNVVQYVGAQAGLLTRPALEKLLAERPSEYKATELIS